MRSTSGALVVFVLLLLAIGIVMLYSTSGGLGYREHQNPDYFLKRQLMWLVIGGLFATFIASLDYHFWARKPVLYALLAVAIVGLLLVFVPGIGSKAGGSRRWLGVMGMSFQPSELGKFALIIWLSAILAKKGRLVKQFKEGLLEAVAGAGMIILLIAFEPDIGTTLLSAAVAGLLLLVAGARIPHLLRLGGYSSVPIIIFILLDPVRLARIMAIFRPDLYPQTSYHLTQSKVAFISGGAFGVGLGNSIQKQLYLPEAHTDFILAIIGEELGFVATGAITLLFLGILICGLIISYKAQDPLGQFLAFGFTLLITMQAALNIGVVTGVLPTKGIPLPLISYGGSSLVFALASVSMLINICAHTDEVKADEHINPIKDKMHRF